MSNCNVSTPTALKWSLDKKVHDKLSNLTYIGEGIATLNQISDPHHQFNFQFIEQGKLAVSDKLHAFSSQYWLKLDSQQQKLHIHHQDQTPFLLLPYHSPLELQWQVNHHCGEDHYQGVIERQSVNETALGALTVRWQVEGPKKNYEMVTQYSLMLEKALH